MVKRKSQPAKRPRRSSPAPRGKRKAKQRRGPSLASRLLWASLFLVVISSAVAIASVLTTPLASAP